MPNRLLELFGSYDLFGKSVPGAIFTLGLLFLLPKSILGKPGEVSLLGIISLTFLLLFIGLMIGQGVHTLADNIEKAFLWSATRARNLMNFLRAITGIDISVDSTKVTPNEQASLWNRFILNGWNKFIEWWRRRYWGTYDSLVGHRYLLGKSLQWNFDKEYPDRRWEIGSRNELYDLFVEAYEHKYDTDILKHTPKDTKFQYPLISGQLSKRGVTQYRTFQSIYSFCRSMWVVFFQLTLIYAFILNGPTILEWIPFFEGLVLPIFPLPYTPIGEAILPNGIKHYIPWILLGGTVIFFDASGTYKRHYVEYLIADFAIHCSESEDDDGDTSPDVGNPRIRPRHEPHHPHDDW